MGLIYQNEILYSGSGGGGATVVPNPSGTPTDDLDTVSIDGVIYNIPGSGGGGVSFDEDILFNTQTTVSSGSSIQLTDNIFDYDLIIIDTSTGLYTDWREHIFIDVSQITLNTEYTRMILRDSSSTYGLRYKFTANDTIYAWGDGNRDMIIYKITGVKFNSSGGGGNSNDRELTWDEYQALPDAEKYNDTNYYITDVNSDGTSNEFQPIIYSENEREIGVWVDGKPLYQKVWIFDPYISIGTSFSTTSNINSTDINDVIYVYSLHEDGTGYCDMMADPTMTNHTELGLKASETHNITRLILQYTKISDNAGSGTWTPQGVPAVHYDDNEKVIGTWFGETLYEKSYELTLPNSYDGQGGFIVDSDGSFIDKLISCEGSVVDVNGYITNMGGLNAAGWHLNLHRNPYNVLLLYGAESPAFGGGTAHVTIRYTKSSS